LRQAQLQLVVRCADGVDAIAVEADRVVRLRGPARDFVPQEQLDVGAGDADLAQLADLGLRPMEDGAGALELYSLGRLPKLGEVLLCEGRGRGREDEAAKERGEEGMGRFQWTAWGGRGLGEELPPVGSV